MADNYNIYQQCQVCGGTGVDRTYNANGQPVERECQRCNGVGEYFWGEMREEEPPE